MFHFVASASDAPSADLFLLHLGSCLSDYFSPEKKRKKESSSLPMEVKGQNEKLSAEPQHLGWLQRIVRFSIKLSSGAWFPLRRNLLNNTEPAPGLLQFPRNLMGRHKLGPERGLASGVVSSSTVHLRMWQRDWGARAQPQRRAALCSFGNCSYSPYASLLFLVGPLRLARLCLLPLPSDFIQASWPNQVPSGHYTLPSFPLLS